jgi:hypothetical protein
LGEDEHKWSVTALLHDFDWEIHPQLPDHPMLGEPILAERGVDEETRRAILSHANYSGVPRVSPLEKTLYACDELAGFITAISYVKPTRSVFEVDVASVKKKMKDKAFARSVSRQDIVDGAQELGCRWTSTSTSASRRCRRGLPSWVSQETPQLETSSSVQPVSLPPTVAEAAGRSPPWTRLPRYRCRSTRAPEGSASQSHWSTVSRDARHAAPGLSNAPPRR